MSKLAEFTTKTTTSGAEEFIDKIANERKRKNIYSAWANGKGYE